MPSNVLERYILTQASQEVFEFKISTIFFVQLRKQASVG